LPIFLTRDRAVSDAGATLYQYGATRGIGHGILLAKSLDRDPTHRTLIAAGLCGSLIEGLSCPLLARELARSPGQAEMLGAGGDFGAGLGAATAHLADMGERAGCATSLLGSGAGFLAGHLLGSDGRYTRGDAYLFRACGTLGACLPLGLVDLGEPEDDRTYTAFATLGGLAGMAYGHRLAADRDLSVGEGAIVNLGMLGGALVGLGTAYLVTSGGDRSAEYLLGGTAGGAAGFALALHWVGGGSRR